MSEEDGLVASYVLDGSSNADERDWAGVRAWKESDGPIWIHLDRTNAQVEQWLREESGLNAIQIDALLASETRLRVAHMDDGILLTLRGVNLNPGADPEDMVSLRIWVDEKRIITMRLRRLMAVNDVRDRLAQGVGPRSTDECLRLLATALVNRMTPVIEEMNEQLDDLEHDIVESPSADIRLRLKELRRQAITLRRYLSPQRDALQRLYAEETPWISKEHRMAFRECADQAARIVEDLDAMRERSAVIQDEIANRTAEHMNKNMYLLSVVAALMLPLGVITGMLGMNVGGVPLSENKEGFTVITILLGAIVALQVLIFRRLKWI